ncbi:MAG: DUF2244 domain-containing protein [Akkermansiaceae bacterium]|nr:DUF2244 domain-containing protein [Akkermansiaceae bacterium]
MDSPVFHFAKVQDARISWEFRRNCSVTPGQLAASFVLISLVSLTIGAFCWFQGAVLVLPFASLELLAVGTAFVVYARHALDGERIWLESNVVVVESENAGEVVRREFQRAWVRIEQVAHGQAMIEICCHGQRVPVGRFVRKELRQRVAAELRLALAVA